MGRSSQGPSPERSRTWYPALTSLRCVSLVQWRSISCWIERRRCGRSSNGSYGRRSAPVGLRAGGKLPPSRLLADELDVSRGVVVEAYSQLVAEGYLVARPGDGTRIADGLAQQPPAARALQRAAPGIRYDLRSGIPDLSFFPRREWQSATATALRELPDAAFTYGSRRGLRQLRIALSDYLGRVRAVVADPERMFISAGAVHGMSILWLTLRQRGARRIAVEDPTWPAIRETIAQAGLEAVPIPVDEKGLIVSELEGVDVDAVVLSPAHQYPTGTVLAPARRAELIAWARRRGQPDRRGRLRRRVPLRPRSDRLAPGPRPRLRRLRRHRAARRSRQAFVWGGSSCRAISSVRWRPSTESTRATPSVLAQSTYATLLERGDIDRHLRRTRRRYNARRNALVEALAEHLPEASVGGASAGLHLIAWLPDGTDETAIVDAAAGRGVAVHSLHEDCSVTAPFPPALLLGYGLIVEPAIPRAVRELAIAAGH